MTRLRMASLQYLLLKKRSRLPDQGRVQTSGGMERNDQD